MGLGVLTNSRSESKWLISRRTGNADRANRSFPNVQDDEWLIALSAKWWARVRQRYLLPRLIGPLSPGLHIFPIVGYILELHIGIALALIQKMRRIGIIALAAGEHALGFDLVTKFYHSDEAVSTGAVDPLGGLIAAHAVSSQGAPSARR